MWWLFASGLEYVGFPTKTYGVKTPSQRIRDSASFSYDRDEIISQSPFRWLDCRCGLLEHAGTSSWRCIGFQPKSSIDFDPGFLGSSIFAYIGQSRYAGQIKHATCGLFDVYDYWGNDDVTSITSFAKSREQFRSGQGRGTLPCSQGPDSRSRREHRLHQERCASKSQSMAGR